MLFSFVLLFTFVVGTVAIFQHYYERRLKTEQLQERLVDYADIVSNKIVFSDEKLDSFFDLFPEGLRITLIDTSGVVTFDNRVSDVSSMENHGQRPEVIEALIKGQGFNIRYSNTLQQDYYYVAIKRHHMVIRTSMAYTLDLKQTYLRPDRIFLYFTIALFIIIIFFLLLISGKLSKAIEALREFSLQKNPDKYQLFPEGELGDIGRRIVQLHAKNREHKMRLQNEKDKLIKHFHYSDSGIAIYSTDRSLVYNNALFVQYSGILSPDNFEVHNILNSSELKSIKKFINKGTPSSYSETMTINERSFHIKAIVFN